MKKITVSDITLREFVPGKDYSLSFREKLEIARSLDKLNVDKIELPPIKDRRADMLTNRTIATGVNSAVISAAVGMTVQSVEDTWNSIKDAKNPALHVMMPVSSVQMEYICGMKAPAVLETVTELVSACREKCEKVEFSAVDATRAEPDFLRKAIKTAIEAGASQITVCDNAGAYTSKEFSEFISSLRSDIPALYDITLGAQLSDGLHLGVASACAALENGVDEIKTSIADESFVKMDDFVHFIQAKGDSLGFEVGIRTASLNRSSKQLRWILQTKRSEQSPFDEVMMDSESITKNITLDKNDDISEMVKVIGLMGYNLSEEDNVKVYEAFRQAAEKKQFIGTREMEAIIASTAMQVPSVYNIDNYVVTNGNSITSMATITLERDGKKLIGTSAGDGPIDASFMAIEQIIGRHYELDDFQIQSVTEGRNAMGSALIKIRDRGRLYSGSGISTDIIGASIKAYINALNKIVYEGG